MITEWLSSLPEPIAAKLGPGFVTVNNFRSAAGPAES
jgi:hypothetical protein